MYVQVRRRVWLDDGCNGFALTDWPEELWSPTWSQPGSRGILMSYMKGERARALAALPEEKRVATMLDHLERVQPGVRAQVETVASKCWDEDPFARGAFAAMTPGQLTALGPHLGRAEGRVYFAGEHASPWQGWMQGALWSGIEAAHLINGTG